MKTAGLAILAFLCFHGAALACTCGRDSFTEHFRSVDLVFEGVVLSVEASETPVGAPGAGSMSYTVPFRFMTATFSVERPIKGARRETREVSYQEQAGGNCGTKFTRGVKYRVYAYRSGDRLVTSVCARSHPASDEWRETDRHRWRFRELLNEWSEEKDRKRKSDLEQTIRDFDAFHENERFIDTYLLITRTDSESGAWSLRRAAYFAKEWRDHERLAELYAEYVKLVPYEARGHRELGEALMVLARHEEAIGAFAAALALDPEDSATASLHRKALLAGRGELDPRHRDYRNLEAPSVDISGVRAPGADFSGGAFDIFTARGARLERAGFRMLRATQADFTGARLAGARFDAAGSPGGGVYKAGFSNADLRGASLLGVIMGKADFTGANLAGADVRRGEFWRGNFEGADLTGADFTEASLSTANMRGARFNRANLTGAKLKRTKLGGADLRGAVAEGADFTAAHIDCDTRLPQGFDVRERRVIPVKPRCGRIAQNRDFSQGDWGSADFSGLHLAGARFGEARLVGTNFTGADLKGADFSATTGVGGRFHGADLTGASFAGADVGAWFYSTEEEDETTGAPTGLVHGPATLHGTDFTGATILSAGFLGDTWRETVPNDVDISTAIFEGARMECRADSFRLRVRRDESGTSMFWREAEDDPEHLKEFLRNRREAEYRHALAWLEAEGALVRSLAARWPTMTFGEECAPYLDPP